MAKLSFAAQIAEWCDTVEGAAEAVWKESAQDVVSEMQTVGHSVAATKSAIKVGLGSAGRGKKRRFVQGPVAAPGAGGNMPVQTGFLRASLLASTAAMPSINDEAKPADGKTYNYDPSSIDTVILTADLGQTLYFGYTAAYARRIEYGFSGEDSLGRSYNTPARRFVALAAQRWPQIVEANVAKLKSELGL